MDNENMENEKKIDLTKYKSLIVSGIILAIVIIIISIFTFNKTENLKLDEKQITVEVGEDYRIYYELTGLSSEQLIWRSTNEDVAIVDAKGNVTALTEGKTMIYVSDDEYIKAIIEVTVISKESE